MNNHKKNEHPEYGLDSRYESIATRKADAELLKKHRSEKMSDLPREQIIRAKLMSLRFKMETFVKHPVYDDQNHFLDFLKTYIDTIYARRLHFAKDINITPVRLSQIVNDHKEPTDEFLKKLMIHSEIVFQNIATFQKHLWYQVYFYEKIYDTISCQENWKTQIAKHVRVSESLK